MDTSVLREKFLSEIERSKTLDTKEFLEEVKKSECNFQYSEIFEKMIWRGERVEEIEQVEIEFVETLAQRKQWIYYHNRTSSMVYKRNPGRTVLFFVKEVNSGNYLGIVSLASDMCNLGVRDAKIGWDRKTKFVKKRLNNIYNINVCVPLQPFGFNFAGGKLLVMLCFSHTVCDYLEKKYGDTVAAYCTTSLYGKSVQYAKLKCIKYIGKTKGFGHVHISETLYQEGLTYLRQCEAEVPSCAFGQGSNAKMRRIAAIFKQLEISTKNLRHEQYRGVYFGYTSPQNKSFLCGTEERAYGENLQSLQMITNDWKCSYAHKRLENLCRSGRFKT